MSTPPQLSIQASRSKNVDEAATQLGESNNKVKSDSNKVDDDATSTTTPLGANNDKYDSLQRELSKILKIAADHANKLSSIIQDLSSKVGDIDTTTEQLMSECNTKISRVQGNVTLLQGICTSLQEAVIKLQQSKNENELNECKRRLMWAEFQNEHYKSKLEGRIKSLETHRDGQMGVGYQSAMMTDEKELRKRKRELESDVIKCEERADSGWNLLMLGISSFGLLRGFTKQQTKSVEFYVSLVLGLVPLIVSTIFKMRGIQTKLESINQSHDGLIKDLGNTSTVKPPDSDSASAPASGSDNSSSPTNQPEQQALHSASFVSMMKQPLAIENFNWRYVLPTYMIAVLAVIYAALVACGFL